MTKYAFELDESSVVLLVGKLGYTNESQQPTSPPPPPPLAPRGQLYLFVPSHLSCDKVDESLVLHNIRTAPVTAPKTQEQNFALACIKCLHIVDNFSVTLRAITPQCSVGCRAYLCFVLSSSLFDCKPSYTLLYI